MNRTIACIAFATTIASNVPMASAATTAGATRPTVAKLSLASARRIALQHVRGTVRTSELERETGGSGLRYTFDIATARGLREVGIDAATGRVLENSSDGPSANSATR